MFFFFQQALLITILKSVHTMIGWLSLFIHFFFFYSTMGTTVIDLQSFVSVRKMQNSTTETHDALTAAVCCSGPIGTSKRFGSAKQ